MRLKQTGAVNEIKADIADAKARKPDDEDALKFDICFNGLAKDGQLEVGNFPELVMILGMDIKASQYIAVKEAHGQPTMDQETFISYFTKLQGGLHLGDALGDVTGKIGGFFSGFGGGDKKEGEEEKKEGEEEKKEEANGEAPAAAAEEAPAADAEAAPAE